MCLIIKVNINDKSIFVLYFDISFLFIKKTPPLRKLNMEWLIAIGKFGDERFSLFQRLCCAYPFFHEIYKKNFNVHATLQTLQAFCITLRQLLSSTWWLIGTLCGLNGGKSARKLYTLSLHCPTLNNYFSCVSFASIFINAIYIFNVKYTP